MFCCLFELVSQAQLIRPFLEISDNRSRVEKCLWSNVDDCQDQDLGTSKMSIPSNAWFDTWFWDRGPVLFDSLNRTPAIEDVRNVLIYISFSTLFIAFLIIFPGIRKEVCDVDYSHALDCSWITRLPLNVIDLQWRIDCPPLKVDGSTHSLSIFRRPLKVDLRLF